MFKFLRNERLRRAARKDRQYSARGPEAERSSTGDTLRQAARARLAAALNEQISVPVTLRYSASDPLAVHIDFPALVSTDGQEMTWTFDRELLAQGLCRRSGIGDVRIWPYGRAYTAMEFRSHDGRAVAKFETAALIRFLLRSYALVERGREDLGSAIAEGLAALLDEV